MHADIRERGADGAAVPRLPGELGGGGAPVLGSGHRICGQAQAGERQHPRGPYVCAREHVTVFDCVKFRAKIFVPNQSDISRPGTVIDALPGGPCYIIDAILRYRVINTLPGT